MASSSIKNGRSRAKPDQVPASEILLPGQLSAKELQATGALFAILSIFAVLEFTRMQTVVPLLGKLRLQFILSLILMLWWLAKGDKAPLGRMPFAAVGGIVGLSLLSIFYAVNNYWAFASTRDLSMALFSFSLPASTLLRHPSRIRSFVRVFASCGAFVAVYALTHAGFGPGGYVYDENDTGLLLNAILPFAVVAAFDPGASKTAALLFKGLSLIIALGVVGTSSRGAFVGLVIVSTVWALTSHKPVKSMLQLAAVGILGMTFVVTVVKPNYLDEMATSLNAKDSTRRERIYFWGIAWSMYKDNPVVGVGAGNFPWRVAEYELLIPEAQRRQRSSGGRAVHSMYFQLLSEQGTVGTAMFGFLVGWCIVTMLRARRAIAKQLPSANPDVELLSLTYRALIGSILAALVCGFFLSTLYYPTLWYLIALVMVVTAGTVPQTKRKRASRTAAAPVTLGPP